MTGPHPPWPDDRLCDVRDRCMVPVVIDDQQLIVARSTLGDKEPRLCGFECVGTVISCPKRKQLKAQTGA